MKPVYEETHFYDTVKVGDEVEYHQKRMTVIKVYKIGVGIRVFDLESDSHIYKEIPEWCVSKPKYTLDELV